MTELHKKAMLFKVYTGMWGAYKADKTATQAVENQFGAGKGSGSFTKKLTGKGDMTGVNSVKERITSLVEKYTVPWNDTGWRILPSNQYMEFVSHLRHLKEEFSTEVQKLVNNLENMKRDARNRLGDLYKEEDYPDVFELERKFYFEARFMPLPSETHFLIDVAEEERAYLEEQARQNERKTVEGIIKECYTRLFDSLSSLAEKLESGDNRWKESTLQNLAEIVTMMPSLNLTNDPELSSMCSTLSAKVTAYSADDLKYSPSHRLEAAKTSHEVLGNIRSYLGL